MSLLLGVFSREKALSMKYRSDLEDRDSRLLDAENRLKSEKEEQKKQVDQLDQEVRFYSS